MGIFMHPQEVKAQLQERLPEWELYVQGDGSYFEVVAVGDVFGELNAVKKQQLVYGALNHKIADGSIHAVMIKTYTPAEWAAQQ